MAEKLALSAETYSQELLNLLKQLDDTKAKLDKLLQEKDDEIKHSKDTNQQHRQEVEQHRQEFEQQIQAQNEKIEGLLATIETNQKSQSDAVSNLEAVNKKLEDENEQLRKELGLQASQAPCGALRMGFIDVLLYRNQAWRVRKKNSMIPKN